MGRYDVLTAIEEDWQHDARGAKSMDFPMLCRALFELADNWCETVDQRIYCSFLNSTLRKIATPVADAGGGSDAGGGGGEGGGEQWNLDAPLQWKSDETLAAENDSVSLWDTDSTVKQMRFEQAQKDRAQRTTLDAAGEMALMARLKTIGAKLHLKAADAVKRKRAEERQQRLKEVPCCAALDAACGSHDAPQPRPTAHASEIPDSACVNASASRFCCLPGGRACSAHQARLGGQVAAAERLEELHPRGH